MLSVIRIFLTVLFTAVVCSVGLIICLFKPKDLNHVYRVARFFRFLAPLYGIKVILRYEDRSTVPEQAIYITNHQNNLDLVTAAGIVSPKTVTVGKKSLKWIPIWGQLYWLSGNILIDRENQKKAIQTMNHVVDEIKQKGVSIWMFPEGTRSRGRGLLPFKAGAFHSAIGANVPIVPICVSNITGSKVNLNRWNNGYVIVEMLKPIDVTPYIEEQNSRKAARDLSQLAFDIMKKRIEELDKEVLEIEASIEQKR
ncbi:1-acylglycerol-3-phosphate O-acyltransferase [Thorsellia kenyensis]|uniref:1-acyl-sn-glycerol-3-phosphate acyltransferase n=1 Tax=Thorsellia kenyensis TaxID=1549888 RepID=A0ABV6CDV0_9GAMM